MVLCFAVLAQMHLVAIITFASQGSGVIEIASLHKGGFRHTLPVADGSQHRLDRFLPLIVKFFFHLLDLSPGKYCSSEAFLAQFQVNMIGLLYSIGLGHICIPPGQASSVNVPVERVTLFSSATSATRNTDLVRSNQRIRPTAPSVPLK
ncbi:hypothetical protein Tco_1102622 [Tanacetum coccineum]